MKFSVTQKTLFLLSAWLALVQEVPAFTAPCASPVHSTRLSSATTSTSSEPVSRFDLAKRERYIATNRFAVRKNQQAKFEKRWATRKSRLATLPGFRYFHLMRRVQLNEDGSCEYQGGETEEEAQENYVSFTIWNKKSDFSAWRKGGGSVGWL